MQSLGNAILAARKYKVMARIIMTYNPAARTPGRIQAYPYNNSSEIKGAPETEKKTPCRFRR